jgi:hypothetical protein
MSRLMWKVMSGRAAQFQQAAHPRVSRRRRLRSESESEVPSPKTARQRRRQLVSAEQLPATLQPSSPERYLPITPTNEFPSTTPLRSHSAALSTPSLSETISHARRCSEFPTPPPELSVGPASGMAVTPLPRSSSFQ